MFYLVKCASVYCVCIINNIHAHTYAYIFKQETQGLWIREKNIYYSLSILAMSVNPYGAIQFSKDLHSACTCNGIAPQERNPQIMKLNLYRLFTCQFILPFRE